MNAEEILEELDRDDRPARVRALRHEIEEATDWDAEIPDSLPRLERWLESHRAAMTKKLKGAAGLYDEESGDSQKPGQKEG